MTEESGRRPPQQPPESEHARVLKEVLDDQAQRRAARDATALDKDRRSDTSFFVQVGLLVSGTLFFYLLFFSPTWITPTAPPAISAERTQESVRFYLFMMAKQVESFRDEEGRLPDDVQEIPGVKPGTEYIRLTARDYRIRFTDGDVSVMYESSVDPAAFLGDAGNAVLGGGGDGGESPGASSESGSGPGPTGPSGTTGASGPSGADR